MAGIDPKEWKHAMLRKEELYSMDLLQVPVMWRARCIYISIELRVGRESEAPIRS